MKKSLLNRIEKLNNHRRQRKWWQYIVRTMALAVVFCTTYVLILPAITMEQEPVCGLEAHDHLDSCYTEQTISVLACQQDAGILTVHSHDALCYDSQGTLVCTLPVIREHTHSDACYTRSETAACEFLHVHNEDCTVTAQTLICTLAETEGHTHGESCGTDCALEEAEGLTHTEACYQQTQTVCDLTVAEGHTHEEACFPLELTCGMEEVIVHLHEENCYDSAGTLTCTRSAVGRHAHSEACMVPSGETELVLTCGQEAHIHVDTCYPLETEEEQSTHFCGSGEHTHVETCYGEEGTLVCSIPEHSHDALCLVKDLDLTADVETAQQWERAFDGLNLSGKWAEDLLAVAGTQLGYQESTRNLVCVDGELFGYTRYGEKYGDPHGSWSAMFVSFCLNYAGVKNFQVYTSCEDWIVGLNSRQLFAQPGTYTPVAGDLIFLDTDSDENSRADHMGIVAEVSTESGQLRIIAGNAQKGSVGYETWSVSDEAVLGFGKLPENPDLEVQISKTEELAALLALLPTAEQAKAELQELNRTLDKAGFDSCLQSLTARMEAVRAAHAVLDEEQKAQTDISSLTMLEAVLNETVWQQLPALAEDGAVVSSLNARHTAQTTEEQITVANGTTALFGFHGEIRSYTETAYGEARVKLEFVLPVAQEKAIFDLNAMAWLEEPVQTTELRLIGETEVECQVLTGYKRLTARTLDAPAVPGSFEDAAAVKLLAMSHGETLTLQIRAAMEHNTWNETCATHEVNETLSILSKTIRVSNPASAEEQQAAYDAFQAEYELLLGLTGEAQAEAAQELLSRISESFLTGFLADEAFSDLSVKVCTLVYGDLNSVAEPSIGSNMQILRDSGWFEAYSNYSEQTAEAEPFALMRSSASPMMMSASRAAAATSDQQVRDEGGYNTSQENAVMVGKTIAGTSQENVFDITLEVITQDVVTEVYKEPDMAVVIVMDISNTMASNFGGITRYQAAMNSAESFLDQFASNNLGASKVGFVAFNTDAHQIFPMSSCSTTAEAAALKNTMRTQTGNIINASGYADSRKRFTNIEAGLKRAYDLLNTVENEHKYIIFLSDGFPTTYISSGYVGYDTYDTSGSRFYDSVELYNNKKRPCSYGTSYSDEAAIRARKMAATLKNNGATIFSIGVDIGGQTIKYYVDAFKGRSFTVVDRRNTNYEIGSASDANAFKNWLGHSIGSGEGYYYDSTNSEGLSNAFDSIFQRIKELNAASSHLDWVTADPMPDMGVHEMESIDFIGFYDRSGNLVLDNPDKDVKELVGVSADGWQHENTAWFDTENATIHWDLKNSGYSSIAADNVTQYYCYLKYRVRLKNEYSGFVEHSAYDTNDVTSLTYRVIDKTGDDVTISEQRTVDYPIPAVEGYLANLEFDKVDSTGLPVYGAEFTLHHDTDASDGICCGYCRGDGASFVSISDKVAYSDIDGKVSFANLPSGHTYTLTETKIPEGYLSNGNTYQITVSYDTLTVTVTDADGNALTWGQFIENSTLYRLPETGGSGTSLFTFGGLLFLTAAALMYGYSLRRKREGRRSR